MEEQVDDAESDSQSDFDCEENLATESKYETQYADKIKVDDKLHLSTSIEDVKLKIRNHVKYYSDHKEMLKCILPVFPSDYALAHMSSMSYNAIDNHKDLLEDWVLLTQASNHDKTNGYHGCAYFNEENQQIVIAHRGTDSLKAVWNDVKGIVFSKFVSQMNSAITFTYKILKLIQKFNRQGAYLKLSLTGHSLGGWLAQVTTFTAKYLTKDKDRSDQFSLINETKIGYHAHAVVFESPGCKQMLEDLRTEYIAFRYSDENVIEISIESLDITVFLSAPNRINCCNAHVGKLYRIFIDFSDQKCDGNGSNSWVVSLGTKLVRPAIDMWKSAKEYLLYSVNAHGIDKIVSCFDPQTGLIKRDADGKLEVQVVLNWPIIEGTVFAGSEYTTFFKWASKFNNYNPNVPQNKHLPNANREIRYHTKNFDEETIHWNNFSEKEIYFVRGVDIVRLFNNYESVLFSVDTYDNEWALLEAIKTLDLMKFQIHCDRGAPLVGPHVRPFDFISFVKRLIHFFPNLNRVKRSSTKGITFDLFIAIFKNESLTYLTPIRENSLELDVGSFNLIPFLTQENSQVLLQVEEETSIGALKIYKVFESVKSRTKYNKDNSMLLDMKTILHLKQLNFASIFAQIKENYLIVIENNESSAAAHECLKQILEKVRGNQNIKLILIVKKDREIDSEKIIGKCEKSYHEGIQLSDLRSDNRKLILKRMLINLQGHRVSLAQIIPGVEKLKSVKDLVDLAADTNRELDVDIEHIVNSRFDVFAVSNIGLNIFQTLIPAGERVISYKDWNPSEMVRFVVLDKNQAENQFEHICWHFSHKSRIHWLNVEENLLILKDSKSRSEGDNDKLIEKLFTERLLTEVHEVLSGCFVNLKDDETYEFFDNSFHNKILDQFRKDFRDCLVIGKDGDGYELNEKVGKEHILKVCQCVSGSLNRLDVKSLNDCIERVFYGNQEVLSGCFVSGESMKSVSSNGKALLRSVISSEVLMKLGSKVEIRAGSELHQLGEVDDYYIERILTKPAKVFDMRKLDASIRSDIYTVCNDEIVKFLLANKVFQTNATMHYETWVSMGHSERVHLIILDVEDFLTQFDYICVFYPYKTIHLLIPAGDQPDSCTDNYMDRPPMSELVNEECVVMYTHLFLRVGSEKMDNLSLVHGQISYKECSKTGEGDETRSIDDIRDSVVTVKGIPGMGKSTFFTNLAIQKKKSHPFIWVFKLKLHTIPWDNLAKLERPFRKEQAKEFLAQILNLNSQLEKSLLEYCLYDEKVVLILDAFDEVSPKYDDQIFGLLDTLQTEMKLKQLWLSSRPYALKDEPTLGTIYTLQGLNRSDQSRFFLMFWKKHLHIDIDPARCDEFSDNLKWYRCCDFNRSDGNLIARVPQILKVLAENYQDEFEAFYKYNREIKVQELCIHKFYERIIDKNINKLYVEQLDADTKRQAVDIESKKRRKTTRDEHKLLALVSCHLDSLVNEQINDLIDSISKGEEITGFISGIVNGVPQFIHATFAEYFAALWIIEKMIATEDKDRFIQLFRGLGNLFSRGSDVVYSLFDSQLGDNKVLEGKLTKYLQGCKDLAECLTVATERIYLNIFRFMVNFNVDYHVTFIVDANPFAATVKNEDNDEFERICHFIYGNECDFKSVIMKFHLLHLAAVINATATMTLFLLSKVNKEHLLDVLGDMSDGSAPLHVAIRYNRLDLAKVLIENRADINLRDKDGFTALDLAVKNQNVEMAELLLYNWVINSSLDFVKTCESIRDITMAAIFMEYIWKCFEQHSECLTSAVDVCGPSHMCSVVGSSNHSLINSLITSGREEISGIKYDLTSLLHSERHVVSVSDVMNAAFRYNSNERLFVALIGNVAHKYPNYLSQLFCLKNGEGDTLMHMAARLGYVRTAELMIGLGADTSIKNKNGETALVIATNCGKLAFVLRILGQKDEIINKAVSLVDLGSDESAVDLLVEMVDQHSSELLTKRYDGGSTMLHIAAQLNVAKAAEMLIDKGADVNVRNGDNHMPLSLACKNGHLEMVELLINAGALINDDQQSPLLWAIYGCSLEIVKILVDNGADVNAECPFPFAVNKCMKVWTPLQLAVDRHKLHGHGFDFYFFLLIKGVDFTTSFSNMPFHLTKEYLNVIALFIMFGADIYTTNNEGVSLVTYLEKHWQSKEAFVQDLFRSVILFSKLKPPQQLLEIVERSTTINYNLVRVVYVLRFKKQIKEKMPDFYNLINACKWKDIIQIEKFLRAVLIDESKFNRAFTYIDELISAEIPSALPVGAMMHTILRDCVTFIYLIIRSLIISDMCHNPKLTLYGQLRICCYEPLYSYYEKCLACYPNLRFS